MLWHLSKFSLQNDANNDNAGEGNSHLRQDTIKETVLHENIDFSYQNFTIKMKIVLEENQFTSQFLDFSPFYNDLEVTLGIAPQHI